MSVEATLEDDEDDEDDEDEALDCDTAFDDALLATPLLPDELSIIEPVDRSSLKLAPSDADSLEVTSLESVIEFSEADPDSEEGLFVGLLQACKTVLAKKIRHKIIAIFFIISPPCYSNIYRHALLDLSL